ncbi:MAG TPA: alkaline phosphatase family protein [Bryobacteraceae bacterium]|nr:alkaline phosphatase family protein [Bryobacteraceae bacterium]
MRLLSKKIVPCLLLSLAMSAAAPVPAPPAKPKLVLAIAVDQFRYDYLTRYRGEYTGGLNRLLTKGAVFTNANYEQSPTVTAIGHSTFLSGALPSVSGIIGNEWFEISAGKTVTSVSDDTVKLLGGSSEGGASPRRLLVSTLGDEMKVVSNGKSRVIGVSLKDRSAILPVGRMADGAFWVEAKTGNVVSSTYYFPELPAWVKDLNAGKPADKFAGLEWAGHKIPALGDPKFYDSLPASPFSNELIELIAERAIVSEKLGRSGATDLLAVSFSGNDYVGHKYGPDSAEAHETAVRTDKLFDKFFRYLETQIGMQNVLVVLTADHGVAPVPELSVQRRMGGGRIPAKAVQDAVQAALDQKFGKGKWVLNSSAEALYLNRDLARQKKLESADVERVAAEAARSVPHIARVYTRGQLLSEHAMADRIGRRVQNGYHPVRGADLVMISEPYYLTGGTAGSTSHGTPYNYDTHVPVIFMGSRIKPGKYYKAAAPNDIAPTLATLLEVEIPSGSSGRVLDEMLAP